MQSRNTEAEELPESIEELLGFILRHVASELRVDTCPEPLAESLRIYTRAVMAIDRDQHEHATPVVEMADPPPGVNCSESQTDPECLSAHGDSDAVSGGNSVFTRPTLPTLPPGVSRSLVPTRRGFPRPVDD